MPLGTAVPSSAASISLLILSAEAQRTRRTRCRRRQYKNITRTPSKSRCERVKCECLFFPVFLSEIIVNTYTILFIDIEMREDATRTILFIPDFGYIRNNEYYCIIAIIGLRTAVVSCVVVYVKRLRRHERARSQHVAVRRLEGTAIGCVHINSIVADGVGWKPPVRCTYTSVYFDVKSVNILTISAICHRLMGVLL